MTLLEVPKTHPSRQQKLDAFKALHHIETHRSGLRREDHPWCACAMKQARELGNGYSMPPDATLFDYVAKLGRLLEEGGILVTGETEREAVGVLCDNQGIPFGL